MDVISWDCYPQPNQSAGEIAFMHDLNRGLKDGQPFLLMEQTPSSQNWQAVNALKRPGVLRLWSYLAVAHGADSVLYFQWRRGRGGSEKLHGAVIEHAGRDDTRVFREVSQIGAELQQLGETIVGARTQAKVAVLFDWENWHALDNAIGPIRDKRYTDTVRKHYLAFYDKNIPVDVVFTDSDFSSYDILIAPMLHMLKSDFADKVKVFVRNGGTFVTTYFSGIVDETDLAFDSGYPGSLSRILGIWVEEIDAMYDGQTNTIVMNDGTGSFMCSRLADLLHTTTAEVLATYGSDFYQGMPCVTKNELGKGRAYYIATDPEHQFLDKFYEMLLEHHNIAPVLDAPKGVEIAVRHKNDAAIMFILNHNADSVSLDLGSLIFRDLLSGEQISQLITLNGYDVRILTEQTHGT
jgi:beta-galactosidase